jgi:hypothetical protein
MFSRYWSTSGLKGKVPFRMVMISISSNALSHKNTYQLGVSTVFEILGHFLFKRGWNHRVRLSLAYHQMLLDTRNKNIYGLGVGILLVFEIFWHFLLGGGGLPRTVMTYILYDVP